MDIIIIKMNYLCFVYEYYYNKIVYSGWKVEEL